MMKNIYLKIAGIINLATALIHLIAGQSDLVVPLVQSNLDIQQKGEWVGTWHIVSILLFMTSFIVLREGFSRSMVQHRYLLKSIAVFYILVGIPYIVSSLWYSILAPQWILLMPIGLFILLAQKKAVSNE